MSLQDARPLEATDSLAGLAINTQQLPAVFRNVSSAAQTPPRASSKPSASSTSPSVSRGNGGHNSDSPRSHAHTRSQSQSQSASSHSLHAGTQQQSLASKSRESGFTPGVTDTEDEEPVKFVLLAEFDIDAGATLAQQYPFPTGTDEHTLAELMLPDGAHLRAEDWTIFYLNQTASNAVAPVLAHESPGRHLSPTSSAGYFGATQDRDDTAASASAEGRSRADSSGTKSSGIGEMLFVLNCVRMKEDKTVRRGALVKALAICTRNPYIQIYKPLLLLALDEYFAAPSPAVLSRLFDSLNAVSSKGCPTFSRAEKLILRASERKDLFEDRFGALPDTDESVATSHASNERDNEVEDLGEQLEMSSLERHSVEIGENASGISLGGGAYAVPSSSNSDRGNAEDGGSQTSRSKGSIASRLRKSSRVSLKESDLFRNTSPASQIQSQSQSSLLQQHPQQQQQQLALGLGRPRASSKGSFPHSPSGKGQLAPPYGNKLDTHYFDTFARFKTLSIPIRIPLSTFEEEVGDYSLINLVQTFTPQNPAPFPGPHHPHLHTSGAFTHPIILLMNALLTQKRIIFLGHGQPAGHVANLVLAACALTGQVLRGFTERAFPYSNLAGLDMLEEVPGFIAGVTNPRFEELPSRWDVLCNMETGKVTVSKEIGKTETMSMHSSNQSMSSLAHSISGTKTEDDATSVSHGTSAAPNSAKDSKGDFKGETSDSIFMDDIMAAIASHLGETVIRAKFADYFNRFIRLAARYEQDTTGSTRIGFPSRSAAPGQLGSGMIFQDEATKAREMALNAQRIEGWRRSRSYSYWRTDFQADLQSRAIKGFDLHHQLSRLRNAKNMSEAEAERIYCSLGASIRTYEQVVELLAQLPTHQGGLAPLALGLFHPADTARDATLDLLDRIQATAIGRQLLASLNMFQGLTWQRLADERSSQYQ